MMEARIHAALQRRPRPWWPGALRRFPVAKTHAEHVLIGSARDAANAQWLWDAGITHVLNCGGAEAEGVHVARDAATGRERPLTVLTLDNIVDSRHERILRKFFAAAAAFLDEARDAPSGRALVHCVAGINRSVTLASAYVSSRAGVPVDVVVDRIAAARPSVLTNSAFCEQLARWEDEIAAPLSLAETGRARDAFFPSGAVAALLPIVVVMLLLAAAARVALGAA